MISLSDLKAKRAAMTQGEWGDPRLPDRFWSMVSPEPNSGCWLWLGHGSYGRFTVGYAHHMAHRFAYEALVAKIPAGLHIDHLCRTRCCVNPGHLEPVTPRENALRGIGQTAQLARKTHCVRGHLLSGDNLSSAPCFKAKRIRSCMACARLKGKEKRIQRGPIPRFRAAFEPASQSAKAYAWHLITGRTITIAARDFGVSQAAASAVKARILRAIAKIKP